VIRQTNGNHSVCCVRILNQGRDNN